MRVTKPTLNQLIKLVATLLLFYIISSSVMLYLAPAPNYEASIYRSISPLYWSMLLLSFLFGIILILTSFKKYTSVLSSCLGFVFLYLAYLLSISTHVIHGYQWWNLCGDTGTHLGFVKEILWTGFLPEKLIYPASHVLLTEYCYILNVDMQVPHLLVPIFFSLLFPLGIYLFSKMILDNPMQVKIATIFGFLFLPGAFITLTPNILYYSLFPFIWFCLLKSAHNQRFNWKILVLAIILLLPMFHPMAGMVTIALLFILIATSIINFDSKIHEYKHRQRAALVLTIILGIMWLLWEMQFHEFDMILSGIMDTLQNEEYYRQDILLENIDSANIYGYNIVSYFLNNYGGHLIAGLISALALAVFWIRKENNPHFIWMWACLGFFYVTVVLGHFVELGCGPTRFLFYSTTLAIPFFGYLGGFLFKNNYIYHVRLKHVYFLMGSVLLCLLIINGILSIYPSPYNYKSSYQTTTTELTGMNWYFTNKEPSYQIVGINLPTYRFYDFIYGMGCNRPTLNGVRSLYAPYHFGYDTNRSLSDAYKDTVYLGLTTRDLFKYIYIFPEMSEYRWNLQDFQRINQDTNILKIYTNEGYGLYLVSETEC